MKYTINSKTINIPDAEIKSLMSHHSLTQDDAIQLWLEDEGYLDNEEVEALTATAKQNRITATIHQAKATSKEAATPRKPRTSKVSDEKTQIFAALSDFLAQNYSIDIVKDNKLIEIELNGKKFKLDLIETRQKKN